MLYVTSCHMEVREPCCIHPEDTKIRPIPWFEKFIFTVTDLWLSSCRPVIIGNDKAKAVLESGRPFIIGLWHFSLLYTLFHFRKYPGVIMVSGSHDGDWVAHYIMRWRQIPIRGSRHKGGMKAIRDMAEAMRTQCIGAGIVADGSRGPARIAQKGAIILARDTGTPVLPTGFSARPALRFKSWDKTMLPWPYSRVAMAYEEPFYVPKDARGQTLEIYRRHFEDSLNRATANAEAALWAGGRLLEGI